MTMTDLSAARPDAADPLLTIEDLSVAYSRGLGRKPFVAVPQLNLSVGRGETVSIVGESGSGKSTIGSAILGLQPAASGSMILDGIDLRAVSRRDRKRLQSTLQAVFQDPFSSLDPSRTVGDAVSEPLRVAFPRMPRAEVAERTAAILARVGLNRAAMTKYPAEFSGGQRQRISIARALVLEPKIVVCDEAVSALDVSVQAQVLNLLAELQREVGTSYVFISHNMAVVRHISDRVVVLYRGRVMEEGLAEDVCDRPAHPYTRSLLASVPVPDVAQQRERRLARASAVTQSGIEPRDGVGCPFADRCPFAQPKCVATTPPLVDVGNGRKVACVRIDEIPPADDVPGLDEVPAAVSDATGAP
ncbi:oligopeptide/dipeptide ABC transporter ATP-binding protein [Microbacterium sp. RD1]|uniref:oligopeptide/dipeptide ABC transporter ATP-binding protein n=1 Tax=Microbacterium sp. RD1 TaxID=3457313 RepID=UPI003FA5A0D2